MRGFGPDPCDGDKVICLRNYWDSWNYDNGDPLVNGTIGTIHNPRKDIIRVPYYAYNKGVIHTLQANFTSDLGENFGEVSMDPKIMLGGESELEWLAFSARYITFEQVLRFLMDYIDGDKYYKTNAPDHNLVRTHAQYKLLRSMEEQFEQMKEIVKNA